MRHDRQLGHIERFGPAIVNSWKGFAAAYQHEVAFRQYIWLSAGLVPLSIYLAESLVEFAVLISGLFLIVIAELLNTAIEAAIDRIGLEHHELSGRAKDLGSAAVTAAILYFICIWGYKLYLLFTV